VQILGYPQFDRRRYSLIKPIGKLCRVAYILLDLTSLIYSNAQKIKSPPLLMRIYFSGGLTWASTWGKIIYKFSALTSRAMHSQLLANDHIRPQAVFHAKGATPPITHNPESAEPIKDPNDPWAKLIRDYG
jgi:hypothetical protein